MSLSLYCKVREPIIDGQKPLHSTGGVFFLQGLPYIQCTECREKVPILNVKITHLIEYVNELWGDRNGTIFSAVDFTAKVSEKEVTLTIDAGGYFNGHCGIFFNIKDFPENVERLNDKDKTHYDEGVTIFSGWHIVDEGVGLYIKPEAGMQAEEIPVISAEECQRLIGYTLEQIQNYKPEDWE